MADDAGQRVTAAAVPFRAHEVAADRCRDLELARDNIAVWTHRVRRVRERLEQRVADTRDRLASVEAERGVLLAEP